ncbi:hypothetical protein D3C83_203110 [compost metagenome]
MLRLRGRTTRRGANARHADRFQLRRCDMDARRLFAGGRLRPALLALRMSGLRLPG